MRISVAFSLYKTGTLIKKQTAESTATFSLTVDASHQGQYTCDYSYRESNSISPRSSSIPITVVNLQQPNISFHADDEGFHRGLNRWFHRESDGPEVTKGYGFSIICSTEPQYPGGSFHLEFSESNITWTQTSVNHSAVFLFPESDFVHQGNYSCTYEVNVSTRIFTSTATEPLVIVVKASLAPYIGVGVTAGLLLILVPVIICFVKTQKGWKFQLDKKKDSQRPKNTYESPQGEIEMDDGVYETTFYRKEDSEDSDNDYHNVDADEQRMDMNNDYEDEEDSDNDYLNVDADEQRMDMNNDYEDEEDSDNDYLNVDADEQRMDMNNDYEDEEDSDNDYLNVDADEHRSNVDNDYEDEEIYANCVA
ncbi:aspartate and serine-rich protein-like [Neoarius graeffei]|uniref:aspartate and serine-rich protein-like n=1 Tax=Neoarius graeffei TaxID=443677 RepID=UPI00298C38B1|nr:aspartate and serine-rich protein-like [Neoarius graeffei]